MKKWIRNKLRLYLGIDSLEKDTDLKLKDLRNKYNTLLLEHDILKRKNNEIINKNDFLISQFNLSADLYKYNPNESWAVISVKGKPEYIKFIDLRHREIKDIHMFLKQFEGTNRTVDAPYFLNW